MISSRPPQNYDNGYYQQQQSQHQYDSGIEQSQYHEPFYNRQQPSAVVAVSGGKNEYYTDCPAGHTGQLPYAYDCRRFLNCWNGRGHIQTCSPGTVFNYKTMECDRPDKVDCGALSALGELKSKQQTQTNSQYTQNEYRSGRLIDIAAERVEVLCPNGIEGLQPHPYDCSKFLNCANGNVHVQQCGPGTAYDAQKMICDYKDKVNCGERAWGLDSEAEKGMKNVL